MATDPSTTPAAPPAAPAAKDPAPPAAPAAKDDPKTGQDGVTRTVAPSDKAIAQPADPQPFTTTVGGDGVERVTPSLDPSWQPARVDPHPDALAAAEVRLEREAEAQRKRQLTPQEMQDELLKEREERESKQGGFVPDGKAT